MLSVIDTAQVLVSARSSVALALHPFTMKWGLRNSVKPTRKLKSDGCECNWRSASY
jgi:hypothetical protein